MHRICLSRSIFVITSYSIHYTKLYDTDADGNYSFSQIPEDAVLVFSFIGMKTQEIPVSGKTTIDIIMAADAIGIEEVVAIGYGTVKKQDLTGAVASVSGSEIASYNFV